MRVVAGVAESALAAGAGDHRAVGAFRTGGGAEARLIVAVRAPVAHKGRLRLVAVGTRWAQFTRPRGLVEVKTKRAP